MGQDTFGVKVTAENAKSRSGRPPVRDLVLRKAHIMNAAVNTFSQKGFSDTSLVGIARDAGVTTRTIYQNFGDKDRLFRKVVIACSDIPAIPPPRLGNVKSTGTALYRIAQYITEFVTQPRSVLLIRLIRSDVHRYPKLMERVTVLLYTRLYRDIIELFKVCAEQSLIPKGDHAHSAEIFIDIILGHMKYILNTNHHSIALPETALKKRVDLFINGIKS